MRRSFLLGMCLLTMMVANSQNTGSVSGVVINKLEQQPIANVNISLGNKN